MFDIELDASDFIEELEGLELWLDRIDIKALERMGDELLRISTKEVPHDTGMLQSTGVSQRSAGSSDEWETGYHTKYAARLHEHPEYNFQKGRKGKYLEDPLKKNLSKWLKIYADEIKRGANVS